jgi:hypothetical protein
VRPRKYQVSKSQNHSQPTHKLAIASRIQEDYGENKVEVPTQHQIASVEGCARIPSSKALDKAQIESAGVKEKGTKGK